jgi:hypothetical protein
MLLGLGAAAFGAVAYLHTWGNVSQHHRRLDQIKAQADTLARQQRTPGNVRQIEDLYNQQLAVGGDLAEDEDYQTWALVALGGGVVTLLLGGGLLLWRPRATQET